MKAIDGHRAHLAHIQFHSYGGGPDDQGTFCSRVPQLAEYVNSHPNITVDVGHVTFGNVWALLVDGKFGPGLPPAEPFPIPVHTGDVRVDVASQATVHPRTWTLQDASGRSIARWSGSDLQGEDGERRETPFIFGLAR